MSETNRSPREGAQLSERWRLVRFDQIAENINERILPENAEGLPYVGLEHLDPESLKIRRWGTPDEVEAQKLHFYPGDIIFGKRRFYQRKLAVADFEGICSAHAMVLRARPEACLPDFLPFFMQSETFFERAMSISVGSLSPTINWKTLAQQEFALPPLDEQRRIAEILWAADEVIETAKDAFACLVLLMDVVFESRVTKGLKGLRNVAPDSLENGIWDQVTLADVVESTQYGTSKRSEARNETTVPILGIPNVVRGDLDLSDVKWVSLTSEERQRYSVHPGDVLLVRTNGNPAYVGRSTAIKSAPNHAVYASYLIRLRVDPTRIQPEYLNILLNSEYLRRTLRHEIRSSAGNYNINTQGLKRQKIPLPPLQEQQELVGVMIQLRDTAIHIQRHIADSQRVKAHLLSMLEL